jgi:hypothetical protein
VVKIELVSAADRKCQIKPYIVPSSIIQTLIETSMQLVYDSISITIS